MAPSNSANINPIKTSRCPSASSHLVWRKSVAHSSARGGAAANSKCGSMAKLKSSRASCESVNKVFRSMLGSR